ncbi:PE-PPE domain-containing protein [Nocardia sp. NBC_01499]|uniref:hypothetical protein n=1 Tax=Nocardia sp. NBC_01499 TaxID=2903597 RepID=UPI00386932CE
MREVLMVEGTWASSEHASPDQYGLLGDVARRLDTSRLRPQNIAYPADYGRHRSYAESKAAGVQATRTAIERAERPVYLVGYSQGAAVAGAFTHHPNVARTYLLADPHRPAGRYIGLLDPGGSGLAGAIDRAGLVHWLSAPGDVITCAPTDSLLRDIADFTPAMSPHLAPWLDNAIATLRSQTWQNAARRPWNAFEEFRRLREALRDAHGYLKGGRHTCYADENVAGLHITHTQWIAASMNYLARQENTA